MRPAHDRDGLSLGTPIYDALYAEYRRLFRALPGDRTGEDKLRYEALVTRRISPPRTGALSGRRRRTGQESES